LVLRTLFRAFSILVLLVLRTQPKRITEVDRITVGVAVEIEASGDADGIFLGKKPPRRTSELL
jgi:hypothetical protein